MYKHSFSTNKQSFSVNKILYLTQFAQIGGGETSLLYLISKLDKRRFEAHIILPQKGQFYNRAKKLKVKIYILKLPPYLIRSLFVPGLSPPALAKLLKLTKYIKPDLIHVNHLTLSIYAGIVAKILKIPTVGTAHGVWDSFYFYQNLFYRFFIRKIIANTQKTANNIIKHRLFPQKNIKIIYFGVDTNLYKPATQVKKIKAKKAFNIPSDYLVISCVGRLDPQKDHLTFLKSALLVSHKIGKVKFLIVGSKLGDFSNRKNAYLEKIQLFLKQHPTLSKNVVFGGFIESMVGVYHATDILVSTSSSIAESFGLALAEAASCAIPIVSTKTASQQLIVKNGITGYLLPPKNPELLAEKMLKLIKDKTLRKKLGQRGRLHITKHLTIENYVKKVQDLYLILTMQDK